MTTGSLLILAAGVLLFILFGPNHGRNPMLVLSRKTSERILIGDDIAITIVRIGPNSVRIGIEAPKNIAVVREEVTRRADASQLAIAELLNAKYRP